MADFSRIRFIWFSGTGNTLLIIKKMKYIFESAGISVSLHRMESEEPAFMKPEPGLALGLAFPVAEQGTYPFIWKFIRNLPPGEGTPVFMADTLLAYSGGIVGPVRKILNVKGYNPIGAREFIMPNNLFPNRIKKKKNDATVARSLIKAESFARAILEGKSSWGRIPVLSDLMGSFSRIEATWKFLRKGYILEVDKEACSRCGLCFRLCPVGNIAGDEVPEFGNSCYICMRCVSFCPTRAIYAPKAHFHIRSREVEYYRAVTARELLND